MLFWPSLHSAIQATCYVCCPKDWRQEWIKCLPPAEWAFTVPTVCIGYWQWLLVPMNKIKSPVEILLYEKCNKNPTKNKKQNNPPKKPHKIALCFGGGYMLHFIHLTIFLNSEGCVLFNPSICPSQVLEPYLIFSVHLITSQHLKSSCCLQLLDKGEITISFVWASPPPFIQWIHVPKWLRGAVRTCSSQVAPGQLTSLKGASALWWVRLRGR